MLWCWCWCWAVAGAAPPAGRDGQWQQVCGVTTGMTLVGVTTHGHNLQMRCACVTLRHTGGRPHLEHTQQQGPGCCPGLAPSVLADIREATTRRREGHASHLLGCAIGLLLLLSCQFGNSRLHS